MVHARMFTVRVLALAGVALGSNLAAGADQVTVCHVPPGDIASARRLTIAADALSAHLAHGDLLLGSAFVFYSGAASASSGANGEGPATTGSGGILANDPVTTVGSPAGNPAVIINKNGAWVLIPNTQWISFADTTGSTPYSPSDGTTINFDVQFRIPNIPGCAIKPSISITAAGDDEVTVSLNGVQVGPSPLSGFSGPGAPGTAATNTGINPGLNTLQFAVTQTAGDGFGLDYRVIVMLD